MERDCLSEEHQILTDNGFMFLKDLEKFSINKMPLIAGYDPETKQIVYETASELIIKAEKTQEMVEVTQYTESSRWTIDSDAYGRSDAEKRKVHSNGVSFIVTPNHDLYFKTGSIRNRSSGKKFIVWDGSEKKVNGKRIKQEVDYSKCKAKTLIDMSATRAIKLLSCAVNGVLVSNKTQDFTQELDLSQNQISDFLELYGYWLGDGSLAFSAGCGRDSIVFSIVKKHDIVWLENIFMKLCIVIGKGYIKSVSRKQTNLEIIDKRYVDMFHQEYRTKYYMGNKLFKRPTTLSERKKGVQPVKRREIAGEPVTCPKSAKWFLPWVWDLNKYHSRSVISGLRRADGSESRGDNLIYTSSIKFRDEIVRLCLHAGYASRFTVMYLPGETRGVVNGVTIRAKYANWKVTYADPDSRNPMFAKPTIHVARDIKKIVYTGRTWCVTVPHGFIITRRAHTMDEVIVKVSIPVIMGNCMIGHGASKFLQERLFEQSDKYSVSICDKCGNFSTTKTVCQSCETDEISRVKLPYISKLILQELNSMMIKTSITAKK